MNSSVIWRRSLRRTPPWIACTASGLPSSELILRCEVVEGVAVLGEDDELARPSVAVGGRERCPARIVLQLGPLAVGVRVADLAWRASISSASSRSSASSSSTVWAAVAASSKLLLELLDLLGVVLVVVEARRGRQSGSRSAVGCR